MPRPKRKYTTRKQESILKRDDSIDSTLMDSKMIDNGSIKLEMWKGQVKDRMKYALNKLNHIQREKLETYELEFNNLLLGFSKDELSSYIDIVSCLHLSSLRYGKNQNRIDCVTHRQYLTSDEELSNSIIFFIVPVSYRIMKNLGISS